MEEKYVFLISSPDIESKIIAQRLKQFGIKYIMKDCPQNAIPSFYGVLSFQNKKIYVPILKLKEAKDLLNLKDEKLSIGSKRELPKVIRIFLFLALVFWILIIVLESTGILSSLFSII